MPLVDFRRQEGRPQVTFWLFSSFLSMKFFSLPVFGLETWLHLLDYFPGLASLIFLFILAGIYFQQESSNQPLKFYCLESAFAIRALRSDNSHRLAPVSFYGLTTDACSSTCDYLWACCTYAA
jgi:hypothetical protein